MVDNWPMEQERSSRLAKTYKQIFDEVGEHRFRIAMDNIIAGRVFSTFPTIAEFNGYIPLPGPRRFCDKCERGYVYVPDWEARELYRNDTAMAVQFCECTGGKSRHARLHERSAL